MTRHLEVSAVCAGYSGTQVLWGVDLQIDAGEVVSVLGPNGAGKTTMASAIMGLLPVKSGTVAFKGVDVTRASPTVRARAGLALVPQGRRVFADLTVEENLAVARAAAGSRADSGTRAFLSDLFPKLDMLAGRVAGTLSGGEQQMLAVGRALLAEPDLIVLDEPSLGLSPVMVADLYSALEQVAQRSVAILLIEQMVGPALALADRVLILDTGRIVARGAPDDFGSAEDLAAAYLGGA